MRNIILASAALITLAACQTTPFTAKEKHLNRYAGAEVAAMQCPAYGGYGSVATMRADAQKNLAQARALGANEADVAKARQHVNGQYQGMVFLVGPYQACGTLINNLAWAGADPAVSDPKPATPAKASAKAK